MSFAGQARIVAYLVASLIIGVSALAASEPGRMREATWREALERAGAALAEGNAREAHQAWEDAYRAALRDRTPESLLAVGRAYLRIGETTRGRQAALSQARRICLVALFQARERDDANGVALAAEAFAALGDREVADRAFAVAAQLAARNQDAVTRERIVARAGRRAAGDGSAP